MTMPRVTHVGVRNAMHAVAKISVAAAHGEKILVELPEKLRRRSICDAPCQHNQHGQCLLCECNIKLKSMFAEELCPDNRW